MKNTTDTRTATAAELAEQARLVAERAARMTAKAARLTRRYEEAAEAVDEADRPSNEWNVQRIKAMIAADLANRATKEAVDWVRRAEDCKRLAVAAAAAAEAGTR